jgi:nitrite reductase (NO-forming)
MADRSLTTMLPVLDGTTAAPQACCAACATPAPRSRAIDRHADRRITTVGIGLAIGFLAAAGLALLVGPGRPSVLWLPVHLALAGGAGTAIAAVLPFFMAALSVAAPAPPRLRLAAIGGVAGGAALVSVTVAAGDAMLAHVGGTVYLGGIGLVAVAVWRPTRRSLATRRPFILGAALAALAAVAVSATIAILFLSGWDPVLARWAELKPAHAWLNLVGFVSLVIIGTLLHFGPTVEGARIADRRSGRIAVVGVAAGATLIALGYALASDVLARVGAGVVLLGAIAVPIHAAAVARTAGRWTTDLGWHRLSSWSLRAATVWFALAVLAAAGPILFRGADPAAWSLAAIAAPFVLGWTMQALIGAWSHLLPAIGPGDAQRHAVQRRWLGRAAVPRLLALQSGTALVWAGMVGGVTAATALGLLLSVVALGGAVTLTVAAVADRRASF